MQGADTESRRALNRIVTHDICDPSLVAGDSIKEFTKMEHERKIDTRAVYPFDIFEPIDKSKEETQGLGSDNSMNEESYDSNSIKLSSRSVKRRRRRGMSRLSSCVQTHAT